METFADMLRRMRQAAGLSQEALAERAGLTPAAIGLLERGERRHPYPHTLRALSDALGLSGADRAALIAAVPGRGPKAAEREPRPPGEAARRWSPPPVPLTPIIGRESDLERIVSLCRSGSARLITLTGPGGIGKSRLAVEAARKLSGGFEVGPAWVDLTPIRESHLVWPVIAHAFGLAETPGREAILALRDFLESRRALLVLDSFEHLLADVPALSDLLERCEGLSVLVTSREALRARGEHEVRLEPLGLPTAEIESSLALLERAPTAALLLQRLRASRSAIALTDADAPALAAICRRLDGIPLALELAAAQLRYQPPPALLDRLEERPSRLEGGPRDLPARHRSLRASYDWSHEQLTPPQQTLFRRLSVFAGGFTVEGARSVAGDPAETSEETARVLFELVDKSLVEVRQDVRGEARFGMLETMRDYAGERLAESGEESWVAERHARYSCDLAERAAPALCSAEREDALAALDAELDNLRAALSGSVRSGATELAMRLAGALGWFWILRGRIAEGSFWTDQTLRRDAGTEPSAPRAGALYVAAAMAWKRGDLAPGRRCIDESVAARRALGDRHALALALALAGLIAISQRDLPAARRAHEESLALFQEQEASWGIAYALSNLGDTLAEAGDLEAARQHYAEALARFSEIADTWGCGITLHTLGNLSWTQGDASGALRWYGAGVKWLRDIGNDENVARGLIGLAGATLRLGDAEEARRLLVESLVLWRALGGRGGIALCLEGLAATEAALGRVAGAARLLGAAHRRGRDAIPPYLVPADLFSREAALTRERLGESEWAERSTEGSRLSLDEIIRTAGRIGGPETA